MENQKVVLITGASDGIGRAIARALAKEGGFTLILVARRLGLLQELAESLKPTPISTFSVDVTHFLQVSELAHAVKEKFHRLDLLVNAAGTFKWDDDPLLEQEPGFLLQINFQAKQRMFEAFRKLLIKFRGTVVNIGSWVGDLDNPKVKRLDLSQEQAYVESMRKLHKWHQRVQKEFEGAGVKMLLLEPGLVATEMAKREFARLVDIDWNQALTPEQFAQTVLEQIKKSSA